MGLSDRLKKLERQSAPPVDIAAAILAGRRARPTATAGDLQRIARRAPAGSLERRMAEGRLRVGAFVGERSQ